MKHRQVRENMGVSRKFVAQKAQVSKNLVQMFEAHPAAVGVERRERLERVYRVLRNALEGLAMVQQEAHA